MAGRAVITQQINSLILNSEKVKLASTGQEIGYVDTIQFDAMIAVPVTGNSEAEYVVDDRGTDVPLLDYIAANPEKAQAVESFAISVRNNENFLRAYRDLVVAQQYQDFSFQDRLNERAPKSQYLVVYTGDTDNPPYVIDGDSGDAAGLDLFTTDQETEFMARALNILRQYILDQESFSVGDTYYYIDPEDDIEGPIVASTWNNLPEDRNRQRNWGVYSRPLYARTGWEALKRLASTLKKKD